jgi:hypothetical protein
VELGEIGGFDCVLEWITCSCIECERLECLGEVNGSDWIAKFILPNPSPSGFSILRRPNGLRLTPDGPRLVSDGACFSIGRSVV